jgi:hypothetical protein
MPQMRLDYALADRPPVAPVCEEARARATAPPYVTAAASP